MSICKSIIPGLLFLSICFLWSCASEPVEVIELQISKSIIPEGIAVHPVTKDIYLSSLHEDVVVRSAKDGKNPKDILSRAENGYSFGVGMDIWDNQLYALSSYDRNRYSILSIKDLETSEVFSFKFEEADSTFFNDLAIDQNGNAYITDTDYHDIYRFDKSKEKVELFMKHETTQYPNGIAISDDGTKLFIDSYTHGIRIVDIDSKRILNDTHSTAKLGIDGLKYHNGALYMIVNGSRDRTKHGLYKAQLNDDETNLSEIEPILVNHEKMNIPTTFSIKDGVIYLLANSQLENLNQATNEIINRDSLENTYVLKINHL